MRGVVLAGGKGTRLGELTRVTNKHLLPVGPWPMIYHPIKKLVGAGITDILLVSGTEHMGDFVNLLGSGREHGCSLTYRVQDEAGGIAQALALAEDFCMATPDLVVLLGDNIFHDPLKRILRFGSEDESAHVVFKRVENPERYGVVEMDSEYNIVDVEEKPAHPKSKYALIGVYMFPSDVFDVIRSIIPSARGELEITDVIRCYIRQERRIRYKIMERDDGENHHYWTDAGTNDSLLEANKLVTKTPPRF